MTIKEITALRKSGKIEEALEAAQREFELNANNYTANALFWCLYDKSKTSVDNGALTSLYKQMMSLMDYCGADEYMARSIAAIERRIDPVGMKIKEAIERAKTGANDIELLNKLRTDFGNESLSRNLYSDYGWLIYYNLKNLPLDDVENRKRLLHDYLKLNLPRPDLLHSLILLEAVKVEKHTPLQFRIRDFMRLWGWENLREDDWLQYQSDNGNTIPSLVEKLIAVYAKELKTDGVESPGEFEELVDKALRHYPNSQHMPFYKAMVLISKGRIPEAMEYYRKLILMSPSKFYLWHHLSALVEDVETKVAMLCKAINVEKDESFIGRCRLDLAKVLIEKGLFANAKYELEKYREFYQSHGWALKTEYRDVERLLPAGQNLQENGALYARYAKHAEEYVYSSIPSIFAIKVADKLVEDRNRPGRKYTQWTLRTAKGILSLKKPTKFGLDNRAPNGSPFDIKLYEGKIVCITQSYQNPLNQDWIKKVQGVIRLRIDRKGNPYAIINGVYVGTKLLKGIAEGDVVSVIGIRQDDGRWSALSLKKS